MLTTPNRYTMPFHVNVVFDFNMMEYVCTENTHMSLIAITTLILEDRGIHPYLRFTAANSFVCLFLRLYTYILHHI